MVLQSTLPTTVEESANTGDKVVLCWLIGEVVVRVELSLVDSGVWYVVLVAVGEIVVVFGTSVDDVAIDDTVVEVAVVVVVVVVGATDEDSDFVDSVIEVDDDSLDEVALYDNVVAASKLEFVGVTVDKDEDDDAAVDDSEVDDSVDVDTVVDGIVVVVVFGWNNL